MPRKDPGMPYDLAPMLKARFGQQFLCGPPRLFPYLIQ